MERHNRNCETFAKTFLAICEDLKVYGIPQATWVYLLDKEQPCSRCRSHYSRIQNPSGVLVGSQVDHYLDNDIYLTWSPEAKVVDMFND